MTVRELIEKLQTFDQEAQVVVTLADDPFVPTVPADTVCEFSDNRRESGPTGPKVFVGTD
jgi:hypothetical protein